MRPPRAPRTSWSNAVDWLCSACRLACQFVEKKLPGIVLGSPRTHPRDYEGDPSWDLFHYF
jgi:hypothetical protein